ncbi:RNA polymerase sigma factor [Myxococcota bacterium]
MGKTRSYSAGRKELDSAGEPAVAASPASDAGPARPTRGETDGERSASPKGRRGSTERFVAEQYRLHAQAVFKKCLVLSGGDTQWAKDVTQDVFVRLLERREEIDDQRNVRGWLKVVAYNLCMERLRRERSIWPRVRKAVQASKIHERPPVDQSVQARADVRALQEALCELPARERTIVVMTRLENLSQRQVSRALGLSEGYVSKLLARAVKSLRSAGWEVSDG